MSFVLCIFLYSFCILYFDILEFVFSFVFMLYFFCIYFVYFLYITKKTKKQKKYNMKIQLCCCIFCISMLYLFCIFVFCIFHFFGLSLVLYFVFFEMCISLSVHRPSKP